MQKRPETRKSVAGKHSALAALGWQVQGPGLAVLGYELVPIKPGTKRPNAPGWQKRDFNSVGFRRKYRGFGIGVKGAKTPGIDLDICDEQVCHQVVAWCRENFGHAPMRIGRAPRTLLVYRTSKPMRKQVSTSYKSPDGKEHRIELIGDGGQFVAYAIHPDTGLPYTWPDGDLTEVSVEDLQELTQDHVDALFRYFHDVAAAAGWGRVETKTKPLNEQKPRQPDHKLQAPIQDLEAAMSVVPIQPETYERWLKIGMALYHSTGGSDEGFGLWCKWSMKGEKYEDHVMEPKWRSFGNPPKGAVRGAATIFADADRVDPTWRSRVEGWAVEEVSTKLSSLTARSGQVAPVAPSTASVTLAPNNEDCGAAAAPPATLNVVSLASFDGQEIAERRWLAEGLIPERNITDLAGDGGTGKSLLALQLAIAVATGRPWLGRHVEQGRVLYMSCEDGIDEIRRRCRPILDVNSLKEADMPKLTIADLTVAEGTELANLKEGKLTMTALYNSLVAHIVEARPKLVIIDTRADAFGGNEIDRIQVRTFVHNLRKLCIEHHLTVLLLSHPSITGMNMGSGQSGSTAWGNSVRSRLYLERAKSSSGANLDPDLRTLTVKKNNYGVSDTEIMLRWCGGLFEPDGLLSQFDGDRAAQDQTVENEFLRLLDEFSLEGQDVGASKSSNYAPARFAERIEAEIAAGKASRLGSVSSKVFAAAMQRLFAKGKIKLEEGGPPSRRRKWLVRVR